MQTTRDDLFVVVRRGDPSDQDRAVDVVVIDDDQVVRAVGALLSRRLGAPPRVVALKDTER